MKPFLFVKLTTVISVVSLLGGVGCANTSETSAIPDDPEFAPIQPAPQKVTIVPTGSLFNTVSTNNIYSDNKARRIGDIITVMLQEKTSASKKAKAEYGKENVVDLQPLNAMGRGVSINGNPLSLSLDSSTDFKGDAKADQSNNLNGQISVHVTDILPNGNLVVRGEKWLTLNTGSEYIRLTGMIRGEDISSSNTIASNRIANARIQYSGTGSFADANKQGWLSEFFYSTWWPF